MKDVQMGLESAPRALLRLVRGETIGKRLVKLAECSMLARARPGGPSCRRDRRDAWCL
jgi:hypothetical protein